MADHVGILRSSLFFDAFAAEDLRWLADTARSVSVGAGETVLREGQRADAFYVLVDGTVEVSNASGGHGAPLRTIASRGQPVGWAAVVEPRVHAVTATARTATTVLSWERAALLERADRRPEFGIVLQRQMLDVLSARLRAARLRLVARRYDAQAVAIQSLIDQHGEALAVSSPAHKLPHYLQSRLTLDDAFSVLTTLHGSSDRTERFLADVIGDILEDVRRELRIYTRLQGIYELVAGAPADVDPVAVREESCRRFVELFDDTDHVIRGEENLPPGGGHVIVMNHLMNHIDNSLPNRFTLTLDSHFVSAMLLYRHYGAAPVRVIRASAPKEYGHRRYYDRLGYIYVTSRVPGEGSARQIDRREFEERATATLAAGDNLVICPEGTSVPTEQSPGRFRAGVFGLAARLRPEPLVVPVVVANFDKRLTETTTVAVVHPPFRMSERIADSADRTQVLEFVNERLQPLYVRWVREALDTARGRR